MTTTEALIEALSRGARPVRRARDPRLLALLWSGVGLTLALAPVLFLLGIRSNIDDAIAFVPWCFTVAFSLVLAVSAGMLGLMLSIPGRNPPRWVRLAPLVSLAGLLLSLAFHGHPDGTTVAAGMSPAGSLCGAVLALLALLPGALLVWRLRRLAPTNPGATAAAVGLAMGGMGALALGLHCSSFHCVHLLLYHGLPVILAGIVVGWLGRSLLRW